MRILYLIDTLQIGGAEQSLLQILSRFQNIEPIICHLYKGDALKHAFVQAGIKVISLNISQRYGFQQVLPQLLGILHEYQPHFIHTTLFRADIAGRIVGKVTRNRVIGSFVSEPYSTHHLLNLSKAIQHKYKVTKHIDKLTSRWVYHFISNSETIKLNNCRELGIPLQKVSVIYRGRDISHYSQHDEIQTSKLRDELLLTPDDRVISSVGRLIPSKGFDRIIKVVASLKDNYPTLKLIVAGDGPDRKRLESIIFDLKLSDRIKLLGWRNDIAQLLHLAEIFIFLSQYEGHPGVLVEAMLARCPVIASDISVHREMIEHNTTGMLTSLDNEIELKSILSQLLNNPNTARSLANRAATVARQHFDIAMIARQYEETYAELSAKNSK